MASEITTQYYAKCLNCGAVESFWSARWKTDTTCKTCGKSGVKNWTIPSGDELEEMAADMRGKPVCMATEDGEVPVGAIEIAEVETQPDGRRTIYAEAKIAGGAAQ